MDPIHPTDRSKPHIEICCMCWAQHTNRRQAAAHTNHAVLSRSMSQCACQSSRIAAASSPPFPPLPFLPIIPPPTGRACCVHCMCVCQPYHASSIHPTPNITHSNAWLNGFVCPITHGIFRDPVTTTDGQTYERSAILKWFQTQTTSPATGAVLASKRLVPNFALRKAILQARQKNRKRRLTKINGLRRTQSSPLPLLLEHIAERDPPGAADKEPDEDQQQNSGSAQQQQQRRQLHQQRRDTAPARVHTHRHHSHPATQHQQQQQQQASLLSSSKECKLDVSQHQRLNRSSRTDSKDDQASTEPTALVVTGTKRTVQQQQKRHSTTQAASDNINDKNSIASAGNAPPQPADASVSTVTLHSPDGPVPVNGTLEFPQSQTKRRYEGGLLGDKPHGWGILTYNSGEYVSGNWSEGKLAGDGVHYYSDGLTKYKGEFDEGRRHGIGSYYAPGDPRDIEISDRDRLVYAGEWRDGRAEGYGLQLFSGNRYEGAFKQGWAHGVGVQYLANGDRFEGEHCKGMAHGLGVMRHRDGTCTAGHFVSGKLEDASSSTPDATPDAEAAAIPTEEEDKIISLAHEKAMESVRLAGHALSQALRSGVQPRALNPEMD